MPDKDKCRNANDVVHTMIKQMIVVFSGSALLIAVVVAIVIASRSLRQPVPLPEAPVAQTPAGVRVKAVERKTVNGEGLTPVNTR